MTETPLELLLSAVVRGRAFAVGEGTLGDPGVRGR